MKKYDIAAYIWPAYSGDEPRNHIFWEEGIGEWQTVKNQKVKSNGYFWDRKPLLGYQNEADPKVMEQQIDMALEHGVNVFLYDWYWYDNRPFQENCLNDGFLKAENCNKMKFYIMWANHDANQTWDIRNSEEHSTVIWQGKVNREQFETIGIRWLEQYFTLENYYKIDNKPVISIYDLYNFITGLGGINEAKSAMQWLDNKARDYGLNGVHFQFVRWNGDEANNVTGVDGGAIVADSKMINDLGFSSLTHYQFVHFANMDRDYLEILPDVEKEWKKIDEEFEIPYFPHVSIGWDNNPRFREFHTNVTKNNTPENFEKALKMAKDYADTHNVNLITINSWNEWTETSYLEPDNKYGYGYLEAIKKVYNY